MNHAELKGGFDSIRNNWIFCLAALTLFDSRESKPVLDKFLIVFGENRKSFTEIYTENENLDFGKREFIKMAFRVVITEAYELLYDYCKTTNQLSKLRETPWFHFTRLIKNGLSHNYKFLFNKSDRKMLPITWRDSTIDINLEGQPLQIDIIGYEGIWVLLSEMRDFILNDIQ